MISLYSLPLEKEFGVRGFGMVEDEDLSWVEEWLDDDEISPEEEGFIVGELRERRR